MKKLITLLLLVSGMAFAALPPTTVWEVRPTVGNDSNGGCFDSAMAGTDFTQQNASQFSGTTLVSVSSLVVSASTHNFVATDVGNCIQITSGTGFTPGFYEIVSTAVNQATLDRSPGTVGVTGVWAEGGALATITQVNANVTANNTVWVKATGTYTVTAALVITLDSHNGSGAPYSIIGYTSTRGDGGSFTWTTATNSIDLIDFSTNGNPAVNVLLQNINFTTTAGTPGSGLVSVSTNTNTVNVTVINCTLTGFVIGIDGNATINSGFVGLQLIKSRVTGCSSHGVRNGIANTYVFGSTLDRNGGDGFNTGTAFAVNGVGSYQFVNVIAYLNGGNGINVAFTDASASRLETVIVSNSDLSSNTGAGFLSSGSTSSNPLPQISNTIMDANGTYGADMGGGADVSFALLFNNAFFNNTIAATRNTNPGAGTITLTATPYTTIGTNFALNNTTGGGKLLKGAGFPGTIPGGGTGAIDVGALQTSGGSGGGQVGFGIIQ